MLKIKRLLANFIDIIMICGLMNIYYKTILNGIIPSKMIETIYNIIYIIFVLILIISKDLTFKGCSIGKQFFNLTIIDDLCNSKLSNKKILFRNIISLLTLPISIFTILLINKSLGDIIIKTLVTTNNKKIIKKDDILKNNKKYKTSFLGKISFISFLLMTLYSFIVYMFFQKINYFSLRNIILTIIVIITLILYIYVIKKTKVKNILVIIICLIVIELYDVPFEKIFIKNKDMSDAFIYNFPRAKMIKKYDFNQSSFIFFSNEDKYKLISYSKENNCWQILNHSKINYGLNKVYSDIIISDSSSKITPLYEFYIAFDELENTSMIVIESVKSIETIEDSLKSTYDTFADNKKYFKFSIIKGKLKDNFTVLINDKKYYPLS